MADGELAALAPQVEDGGVTGGRVHDSVVRILAGWVLGGRYAPGDTLPREEDLTSALGISRTSLREAVKVLAAKGLLEVRPRIGVRVRARQHWRLLDPAVLGWHPDLTRDPELIRSLIEARRVIEPAAAEFAARRCTQAQLEAIETAYLGMERAIPHDLVACCEADLAFHRAVVAASGNIVLTNLVGTIEAALRASFLLTTGLMQNQARTLSVHKAVLECIRAHDTAGARSTVNRLLDLAEEDSRRLA